MALRHWRAAWIRLRTVARHATVRLKPDTTSDPDGDLDEELASHLQLHVDDNVRAGMTPGEARRQALLALGGVEQTKEQYRDRQTFSAVENVIRDIRYGTRVLCKDPAFTIIVVLMLAMGVGANTAIFQLLDAVRLRALPVKDPQQLAEVRIAELRRGRSGTFTGRHPAVTNPMWEQIRDRQQAFSSVFAWGGYPFNISSGGESRFAQGLWVSGGFFDGLGIDPVRGRLLTVRDDHPGCASPGVVISYLFWQREHGGDASAIGKTLFINGHPFEVIGVTPAGFNGVEVGRSFDVAAPICAQPIAEGGDNLLDAKATWWLGIVGRLKPGWTLERASAHLAAISPGVFRDTVAPGWLPTVTEDFFQFRLNALPAGTGVSSNVREQYEAPLWLLFGITGLVLLVACANIANLMLVRATVRRREIAVRLALGASRGRIVRQLLVESLLLAAAGTAAGAALAQMLGRGLVALLRTDGFQLFAVSLDLRLDWHSFAFTAAVAVITCVLFGLVPACRATRTSPEAVMRASGRGLTDRPERFAVRRALVVGQVALSLVLVVGALLFMRTLWNLTTLDPGFNHDKIWVATVDYDRTNVPADRRLALRRDLLDRIRALPGVEAAAVVQAVPLSGESSIGGVVVDGVVHEMTYFNRVSAGYFAAMGTPILAGRDFSEQDIASSPRVAIVNETFAREYLHAPNPVGRTYQRQVPPGQPQPQFEIVGLVKDAKHNDLREPYVPMVYLAETQITRWPPFMNLVVRVNRPVAGLAASVNRAMNDVNPAIVVYTQPLDAQVRDSLIRERLMATLSGFFGLLAGLLSAIGLYGVMSYVVTRRTGEIGIRMALGADRRSVMRMILREAARLLIFGLAIGTMVALAAGRAASGLLFGLTAGDPGTYALGIALLAVAATLASYLPAARAARVEPMVALRAD